MIFVAIFCASKWLKWKVATLSLTYYIEKISTNSHWMMN